MARNSKNWTTVNIGTVEFSKRPVKILDKASKDKILVGYAQVPVIPDDLPEADAKQLLTEWLEDGVLGYRQTLVATINALAVQTQAAVRRKYESAMNGKHTEDELFNIGFAKMADVDNGRFKAVLASGEPKQMRQTFIGFAREQLKVGGFDPQTNIVTSDNTMSTEDDSIQQQ